MISVVTLGMSGIVRAAAFSSGSTCRAGREA
jgi:hypothetical protein